MRRWVPAKLSKRRRLAELIVPEWAREKADLLRSGLGELGVDPFGYDPDVVMYASVPATWLYKHYFRAETHGIENVPDDRVLLVSNHSGQLPFDGLMLGVSLIHEHDPPRVIRTMVEKWVPRLPFVSVFLSRCGQVVGTPDNCRRLLAKEEAILVFPEGARGISKTFNKRYQLERFGRGFVRLALETNTPIVPIGVIGAEEQAPSLHNLKALAKVFRMPAFPITPTFPLLGPAGLLPLPTRYRIYYGEPILFEGYGDEEDDFIDEYVEQVKSRVDALIQQGLSERSGVFF